MNYQKHENEMASCEFNPKNKPTTKIGTCQCDEHYDFTENKKRGQNVYLWMQYSKEYCDFMDADHSGMDDDDLDKLYDEMENKQCKPNTEKYYCESCMDEMRE